MTVDELRKQLDDLALPGDTPVILATDAEGNRFSPLAESETAMYAADSTWSGERHLTEEARRAAAEADPLDGYDEAPEDAVRAVFLWPTN